MNLIYIFLTAFGREGMVRNTAIGNIRSFLATALGGLKGRSNVAAWIVAGSAAYFLWVKPERDAQKEREVKTTLLTKKIY